MKIQSAYLQNSIPEKLSPVNRSGEVRSNQFEKIVENLPAKETHKSTTDVDSLELSDVTKRVLSQPEKQTIAALFSETEQEATRVYTANGKSVTMASMIGKKIDIKG